MVINAASWQLVQQTLVLQGIWLRAQVATVLPVLPKEGMVAIDLRAVTQVDSSVMTLLLQVRAQSKQIDLFGASNDIKSLLTLYGLNDFFVQKEVF
jgi:ABC-type transporter Mla MlaB component